MGHKTHPLGLRLGIIKDWDARWYADKEYAALLQEDLKIRKFIKDRFFGAGVSKVGIERAANRLKVSIHTARPGMVIGKGGTEVDKVKSELEALTGKQVAVNIVEIKQPDLDAQLVAENIAFQLERRISFRRAMKQAIQRAMRLGAQGIKTAVSGRLGGAEIARSEWFPEGKVPLHTLRADIDYGFAEANTTYGKIGVKVWIYKGEVFLQKGGAALERPRDFRDDRPAKVRDRERELRAREREAAAKQEGVE
ncbi:MAG: 30S ribosomal protein S3 [Bacillota bacterium]|nr:30S ribosomal protein S3 [Bacillota bacterium]